MRLKLTAVDRCILAVTLAALAALLAVFAVNIGDRLESGSVAVVHAKRATQGVRAAAQPDSALVDINSADVEELSTLPQIGPGRAQAIVDWREENGPFRHPEDLVQVEGIGESTYEQLEDLITVGRDDFGRLRRCQRSW